MRLSSSTPVTWKALPKRLQVVHNATLRQTLQYKGIIQAQKFSWDTAAQKTLDLYMALGG